MKIQEKRERKIIIEEKDAFVVQALLFYLYHAHYDDNRGNEPEHDLQLTFNVKVYYLAEEYQMDVLKIRARERFEAALKKPQNLADSDIRAAIDLIYNTLGDQDKKLQEALTKLSTEGFGKLSTRPGFKSAMQEIPGFGSDVAFKLAKVTRKYTCTACSSCVASATHLKLSKAWCEKCRTVKTDQLLTQTEFVSV